MSASSLVVPLLIYRPFGADAANPTYLNIPIPDASQIGITINAASFADGFPPTTMTPEATGGLPFFGQDMNGILWMVSAYCANFAAGALPIYNATLATNILGYPLGVVLVNTNGNGLWVNVVDGNTTNPDTGGLGWIPMVSAGVHQQSVAGSSDVTLLGLNAAYPCINLVGVLTGNINVIFPSGTANGGRQWIIMNSTTGAFTITLKTAAGTGVLCPQTGPGAPTSIYCDNTNIQYTGVSTAGLAPLNSPAFTGTPTAPTASSGTNTTQIATTAMVQAAITAGLSGYAPLASPIFVGSPTAPTPAANNNSLRLATTAYVDGAVNALPAIRAGTVSLTAGNNSVSFTPQFTSVCTAVVLVPLNANPDTFTTTKSKSGFTCTVQTTQVYMYIAVGD